MQPLSSNLCLQTSWIPYLGTATLHGGHNCHLLTVTREEMKGEECFYLMLLCGTVPWRTGAPNPCLALVLRPSWSEVLTHRPELRLQETSLASPSLLKGTKDLLAVPRLWPGRCFVCRVGDCRVGRGCGTSAPTGTKRSVPMITTQQKHICQCASTGNERAKLSNNWGHCENKDEGFVFVFWFMCVCSSIIHFL